MANSDQQLASFYVEHHRQAHEQLREADRKRDIAVGWYLTIYLGVLGLVFSWILDVKLQYLLLVFLLILGLVIAYYIFHLRRWHCEYDRSAQAIHLMFLEHRFNLLESAGKLKSYRYFNPRGGDFWIVIVVLLAISGNLLILLMQLLKPGDFTTFWKWLALIGGPMFFLAGGIGSYAAFLYKEQKRFPMESTFINPKVRDDSNEEKPKPKQKISK